MLHSVTDDTYEYMIERDASLDDRELPRLDDATLYAAVDSLLSSRPAPDVMAFNDQGLAVSLPLSVPVAPNQVMSVGTTALELCVPGDLALVVDAWSEMRRTRAGNAACHLRSNPARAVTLTFFDTTERYGVYLGVLIGREAAGGPVDFTAGHNVFRPKLCTIERNEIGIVRAIDEATTQILGWTAEDLVGFGTVNLTHPDERASALANWMDMLKRPGREHRVQLRYRHRDGHYVWLEISNQNLLDDPVHPHVRTQMLDVSDRMEAIEALRASEDLLRRLTETLPLGILQIDAARRIVYQNERLNSIVGAHSAATFDERLVNVVSSDQLILQGALGALLASGEPADIELTVAPPDENRRCSVGMRALSAESGEVTGAIICFADITERVRMREELERRAKYDLLTHCHNRTSILETLESVLAAPDRSALGMAVLFIDLDRFKAVNDRFGHATGDELLKRTAERLRASVRTIDIIGRLGGDEFLVVCPDVPSPEGALDIARRISDALDQRTVINNHPIEAGSSIGVAWTSRSVDTDMLVACADAAMYESKRGDHRPVMCLANESTAGTAATLRLGGG